MASRENQAVSPVLVARPEATAAFDAVPEAYHNLTAVWWGHCGFRGHPEPDL